MMRQKLAPVYNLRCFKGHFSLLDFIFNCNHSFVNQIQISLEWFRSLFQTNDNGSLCRAVNLRSSVFLMRQISQECGTKNYNMKPG